MANTFPKVSPPGQREPKLRVSGRKSARHSGTTRPEEVLVESIFHSMLTLERRRAERSGSPFVLMLLDANSENGAAEEILSRAIDVVFKSKRETDLVGWYKQGAILGIIFTEVSLEAEVPITEILRSKIETAFVKHLGPDQASKIANSVHLFPASWDKDDTGWVEDSKLYPVLNTKVS